MLKALPLTALLAVATPAMASGPDIHVRYDDLVLASPAGLSTLDRRISDAINEICAPIDSMELARRAAARRCRLILANSVRAQRDSIVQQAALAAQPTLARR